MDHKPLLGILNDKSLADIENPRLLMLKEKTLWFTFDVLHVAGRLNSGPDYISRTVGSGTTKDARVGCLLALAGVTSDSDTVTIYLCAQPLRMMTVRKQETMRTSIAMIERRSEWSQES